MKNGEGHTIYFLGIGGIGMSALARYYHSQGYTVAGYDRTPSPLTKQLEDEGMAIHYEDNPNLLPAFIDRVVYTPAVPKDLKEFDVLRQRGLTILKRSEALGQVTEGHFTIAVAGTHGKTTTTAMVAHILNHCGVSTTAFIGGIANNFNSNLLLANDVTVRRDGQEVKIALPDTIGQVFLRDNLQLELFAIARMPFVIDSIMPDSPAEKAGLMAGDSLTMLPFAGSSLMSGSCFTLST